jgi:hypothetical protein
MDRPVTYIGLDVHKDTIAVALAQAGKREEARMHGGIANIPAAVKTLSAKLARGGPNCGSATKPGLAVTASSGN